MQSFPNGNPNPMDTLSLGTMRLFFDEALATIQEPPQLTARETRLCVLLNISPRDLEALLVVDAKIEAMGDQARQLRAENEQLQLEIETLS